MIDLKHAKFNSIGFIILEQFHNYFVYDIIDICGVIALKIIVKYRYFGLSALT